MEVKIDIKEIVEKKIKPVKKALKKMCWKRSQYKRRKR